LRFLAGLALWRECIAAERAFHAKTGQVAASKIQKGVVSFTPGFSPAIPRPKGKGNRFQRFLRPCGEEFEGEQPLIGWLEKKTVKTVPRISSGRESPG
jgi:hypothetical protein